MTDLNINKIHTTPMGEDRIKRNLNLDCEDVVEYCKSIITRADSVFQKGKNLYAIKNDVIITINAKSFTIITAHKTFKLKDVGTEP